MADHQVATMKITVHTANDCLAKCGQVQVQLRTKSGGYFILLKQGEQSIGLGIGLDSEELASAMDVAKQLLDLDLT